MSRFLTGVSEDQVEDCRASMLLDNMDQGRLMAHDQQVEEILYKRKVHEGKRPKAADKPSSSLGRGSFGVQSRPKLKRHSVNSAP